MNRMILAFFTVSGVAMLVAAEQFPPPNVEFYFSLSDASIRAGEPLSVLVKLQDKGQTGTTYLANFFLHPEWNCDIKMELYDGQMNSCGKARHWILSPWRQRFSNYISVDDGCFDLPLHMRLSTVVPAGQYKIQCSMTCTRIRGKNVNGTEFPKIGGTITSPLLALEIRPPDTASSAKVYSELLADSLKAQSAYDATHGGILGDWMDYVPELRRLMWAWGAAAVPAQLKAIHNGHYFPFNSSLTIFAYQNILEHPNREAVEELVALAKEPSFVQTELWSGSYDPNLVWTLDELRKRGDPQYVSLIEPVLARFKTPVDLGLLERPFPD